MEEPRKSELKRHVGKVRGFNRFYTKQIGLLNEGLYGSRFSLSEMRVLQEIWRQKQTTATAVRGELGLDAGYLSRMLQRFEKQRLIRRTTSKSDGRQSLISLTAPGRKAFLPLEARANTDVAAMLKGLSPEKQARLVKAMSEVQEILSDRDDVLSRRSEESPQPAIAVVRSAGARRA